MSRRTITTVVSLTIALSMLHLACGDDDSSPPKVTPDAADVGMPDVVANDGGETPDAGVDPLGLGPVDRAGRESVGALIPNPSRNYYNQLDVFDLYNFYLEGTYGEAEVSAELQSALVQLDKGDGVDSWDGGSPEGGSATVPVDLPDGGDGGTQVVPTYPHPLVDVLKLDALTVDTSKPFSPTGYLDIEFNSVVSKTPGAHATCGGRWMNDDALDKMMSLVVKRSLAGVSDNVGAPEKPSITTFPYLVPAN